MAVIIRILFNAAALWVAVAVLDGLHFDFEEQALWQFFAIALIMGVVNVVVRPVLTVLALPAIVLTLGLFLLVVNALVLWIVIAISGALDLGLASEGFGWTFLGAIIIAIVSWGLELLVRSR